MLKEFLNAIAGPVQNAAFTNPYANGISGVNVPAKATFGKMLSNIFNSFTGTPSNMFGQVPGYGGQNQNYNPAVQAYTNSLGGQNFFGAVNQRGAQREAFSPGSVVNTLQMPPTPQTISASASPFAQLTGAINPLQGFAGQAGVPQGAIPGAVGAAGGLPGMLPGMQTGNYGYSPMGFGAGAGGLGKWSALLMPLVGIVSVVKSLFNLKGIAGSLQPIARIDKNAIDYVASLEGYEREQNTEGSFDEGGYWGEEDEGSESGIDSSNFES